MQMHAERSTRATLTMQLWAPEGMGEMGGKVSSLVFLLLSTLLYIFTHTHMYIFTVSMLHMFYMYRNICYFYNVYIY